MKTVRIRKTHPFHHQANLRRLILMAGILSLLATVAVIVSCSPENFSSDPGCTSNCGGVGILNSVTQKLSGAAAQADILFVDDNSGSMSFEQNDMASKFSTFISMLDGRGLDYRIGITTTDISSASNEPRAINQNGALQNGRLIPFANGRSFLTNADGDRVTEFANNIQRPETRQCEQEIIATMGNANPNDCPSGDERGIYGAYDFINGDASSMLRTDASLEIIFLSDEDVRSQDYDTKIAFKLDPQDLPQNLLATIQNRYNGKNVHFDAVTVDGGTLKNTTNLNSALNFLSTNSDYGPQSSHIADFFTGGDSSCLASQSGQLKNAQGQTVPNIGGSYGYVYKLAALLTGGISGSICSNSLSSTLSNIAGNVATSKQFTLSCSSPTSFKATATKTSGAGQVATTVPAYSISGNQIIFTAVLPSTTTVTLTYQCPSA